MPTRRAVTIGIAAVPFAATPALAAAYREDVEFSWSAILERLELVVDTLRNRYVRGSFKLDEEAASAALAYVRGRVAGEPTDDEADDQLLMFVHDHGQSIDFVIGGDIRIMLCICAASNHARATS